MSTTLEQRQAVGTEAAPKVVRKPGRGPIWPFIVGGLALLAVVVAGITFAVSEPAPTQIREGGGEPLSGYQEVPTQIREGGAFVIVAPTGTLQGLGIDQRVGQAYLEAQEQLAGSNAPTGTLQGLANDPQIGQAYLDAADRAGSDPQDRTDWWNLGGGSAS